jgi:hypothetical protein
VQRYSPSEPGSNPLCNAEDMREYDDDETWVLLDTKLLKWDKELRRTVSKPSETVPTNLRSETLVPVAVMTDSFLIELRY